MTVQNIPLEARVTVFELLDDYNPPGVTPLEMDDVYVVWFCKTLQNWKALVSTTRDDGRYYEVTYNGDKLETYVDTYAKVENARIPDQDFTGLLRTHSDDI